MHYHEFIAAAMNQKDINEKNLKVAFEMMSKHRPYITGVDIKQLLGIDGTMEDVEQMLSDVGLTATDKITFADVRTVALALLG